MCVCVSFFYNCLYLVSVCCVSCTEYSVNKDYYYYQMTAMAVTLNDLEGHSLVAGLYKCNLSNVCAAFYTISTESVLARFLCISRASCYKQNWLFNTINAILLHIPVHFYVHNALCHRVVCRHMYYWYIISTGVNLSLDIAQRSSQTSTFSIVYSWHVNKLKAYIMASNDTYTDHH